MSESPSPSAKLESLSRENARLKRENQILSGQLAQFQEVARVIVDEPDRLTLTGGLAVHLARLLKAERVMIGIPLDQAIVFEQMFYLDRLQPVDLRFRAGEGLAGWVMVHKRPYLGPPDPTAAGQGFDRSALAVPVLNHQGHLLGLIECHKTPNSLPFNQSELDLLQIIARQLTPSLERAHLFDQMQRWITSFESLLMFSASLNGRLEPGVLIRRLVENAAGFLGAEAGLAGLNLPPDLVTDAYWGSGGWQDFNVCWLPQEESGTPGWVLVNQCPYLTNDYPNDPLANPSFVADFRVKNALCVPIMDARERVLGFVELHNKGAGQEPFTWSDAHFLEALTNSTAIALHNAHLVDELKTQQGRLQALAAQHLSLLEDERRRIARELHDEAGQVLIGIKLGLQVLGRRIPPELPGLREEIDRLRQQVNESTTQLKEIARTLRPPILDELGLEMALNQYLAEFQNRTGLPLHFETARLKSRLPQPVETACYRIVQEALTNILRHAAAEQVWITLAVDVEQLYLSIRDDGCGFDPVQSNGAGLGLLGMQERVAMLNGTFRIDSAPGAGATIRVHIPLPLKNEPFLAGETPAAKQTTR